MSSLKEEQTTNLELSKRQNQKSVLLILAITLAIYLPVFLHMIYLGSEQLKSGEPASFTLPVYGSDSVGFVLLADELLSTHQFTSSYVETFRTPGFPMTLASWKGVFGSYRFFPLFQIFLTFLTSVFIYFIGKKLFRNSVGMVGAVLYLLSPNVIFHANVILSETVFVFLLVLAVFLVLCGNERKPWREVGSGLALGFAVLVKPIAIILPLLIMLVYAVKNWSNGVERKRIIAGGVIILLCFGATVMPWLARNHAKTGVVGFSSVSSVNLFFYNVPEFLSFRDGISPDQGREIMAEKVPNIPPREWADLRHSSDLMNAGLSVIKDDPIGYAKFHALKTIPFFLSSGLDNIFVVYNDVVDREVFKYSDANLTNLLAEGNYKALLAEMKKSFATSAEQFVWLGLLLLAVPALVFGKGYRLNVLFLILFVAYFAVLTGPVAYARFRMPVEPFIMLLAVFGFFVSMDMIWPRKQALRP
jgi:4-amino-4-deoxy-L-arabinose transferase-like glycosyltransferase